MDGRYGLTRQRSGLWRSMRDEDFDEEEVWDVLKDRKDSSFPISNGFSIKSSASFPSVFPTSPIMIPRDTFNNSSSSSSNNFSHETKVIKQSAPVNIPDWSKISGKKSKNSSNINSWLDDDDGDDDDDDDGDGKYISKVPPHEFVARRLARIQVSSCSVFEGVGRTLKGRDLSRVRHAVLTKTGFLEMP